MIRLIRFFFIIKSYTAVFPGRNTPIIPGTGYRQSGLRIARNPRYEPYRPAAPHPRRHGKTIRQPVSEARPLLLQYRARMREHCDVRTRRHRRSRIPQLRHSLRTGRQRRAVPAGREPGDTGYGNAIVPERYFATASFARICASMSSVMRERSHSGFQPHSSRAQVSSSELGQLSAISFFTGSTS